MGSINKFRGNASPPVQICLHYKIANVCWMKEASTDVTPMLQNLTVTDTEQEGKYISYIIYIIVHCTMYIYMYIYFYHCKLKCCLFRLLSWVRPKQILVVVIVLFIDIYPGHMLSPFQYCFSSQCVFTTSQPQHVDTCPPPTLSPFL